jgi:hypothetical protein
MADKRDAQTPSGNMRFRGASVEVPDGRHLDNRERMRHEQRSLSDLGAQEAIGDAFQPEHDAIMAEMDLMMELPRARR